MSMFRESEQTSFYQRIDAGLGKSAVRVAHTRGSPGEELDRLVDAVDRVDVEFVSFDRLGDLALNHQILK